MDFSTKVKVIVTIIKHIQTILYTTTTDMYGLAGTPAAKQLFQVQENEGNITAQQEDLYLNIVERIRFVSFRPQSDLKTSIAFLTMRVYHPNIDDYKNLVRCVRRIRATEEITITLEASKASVTRWWIDSTYGVHSDTNIHSGGMMSLEKGAIQRKSINQKLNTQSSTGANIVGVDNHMSSIFRRMKPVSPGI